jgi:Tfp pilus assembly protein PilO
MEATRSAQFKELAGRIGGGFRRARLSAVEIAFLIATVLFVLVVVYFYLAHVQPKRSELNGLEGRERAARSRILAAEAQKKKIEVQQTNASRIVESLSNFENRLKDRGRGTPQLIDEIDKLARENQVIATDYGYRMAVAEPVSAEGQGPASLRNDRDQQIYTALGVDTTLTGDYQNLRRLIAAIERSSSFILINGVAFQGETNRGRRTGPVAPSVPGQPGAPGRVAPGQPAAGNDLVVSLRLEMETYFRNQ